MHITPLILLELWCLVSHVTPCNSAILCLCLGRDILVWLLSSGILGLAKIVSNEQRWLPQPNFEYNEEVGDVCWTMLMYGDLFCPLPRRFLLEQFCLLALSQMPVRCCRYLSPAFVSELPKRTQLPKNSKVSEAAKKWRFHSCTAEAATSLAVPPT